MTTYQVGFSKYNALSQLYIEDEIKKDIVPSTAVLKNGTNETHDEYDNGSDDDDYDDDGYEDDENYRSIVLFYTTTKAKISTTSVKVDFLLYHDIRKIVSRIYLMNHWCIWPVVIV